MKRVRRPVTVVLAAVIMLGASAAGVMPLPAARAASHMTLDCRTALFDARVVVRPPAADGTVPRHVSYLWYKFAAASSASGTDWRRTDPGQYFYGTLSAAWITYDYSETWAQFGDPSWFWSYVANTGYVYVWEYQYDVDTEQWTRIDLGNCPTLQYFEFYPFPGL